ncbi:MAG: carboxypeptidase-like regulatory domain-containing protein, partial [Bacteroidota bacterium]
MKFLYSLLCLLVSCGLYAQTYDLKIITTDADTREALGFVNVQVEGTSINGTSNQKGELSLRIPSGKVTLLASFL